MSDAITNTYTIPDEWRALSSLENAPRKVGGDMGKHDFLMLLTAQLRYQDPLEPMKDSDFAAQLAQFSALEQMENMNATLAAMSNYQAYGLVGKFVVATAYVDGVLSEIPGIVDCIFTKDGVTFAQIGEYAVPISAITDVYDSSHMLTPQMLIETSNNLIGRTVKAQDGNNVIEGVVTSVFVDDGNLWARIADNESGEEVEVQVGCIFDIRQAGSAERESETQDDDPLEAARAEAEDRLKGLVVSVNIAGDTIAGEVDRVIIQDGALYAVVKDDEGDETHVPIESIDVS